MTSKLTRWIVALALSGLMMALVLAGAARAQEVAGDWHGTLTVPTGDLRLAVAIKTATTGGFEGTATSVDQGGSGSPLADIKLEGQRLSFAIPVVKARYEGQWDATKQAWVGTFTQGAGLPLTLVKGKIAPGPVVSGLDGSWEGAITLPTAKLRVVLRVKTGPYGTIAAVDVPDQLTYGLVASDLKRDGQAVTFLQKSTGSSYAGTLSADGKSIDGAWTQRGVARPLVLAFKPATVAKRPQTPTKPYPYREVEAAIPSAPGVVLAGTLTLPPGPGPFPAAVMITGSGAQDRDETLLGHKPFLVIADRLTRSGIAVLRYDDRGFAKSTGDFAKATVPDFAIDAEAASAWLRKQPGIDPKRVGLIGHSEGGIVAPMVAVKDPKVAFIVMIAGPGAPLGEVMRAQRAALGPSMGQAPDATARQQAVIDKMMAAMHGAKDDADAEARALAVLKADGAALGGASPEQLAIIAKQYSSSWIRGLMDYDPGPTLAKVRVPILAVNGSKDMQVPAQQNLSAIRTATRGAKDVTTVELAGLNHLLQTAPTGAAGEYADIEETVSPIALDTISNWVVAHTNR
jgi:pimeloyl-ACP methyl ester carboxylesterase